MRISQRGLLAVTLGLAVLALGPSACGDGADNGKPEENLPAKPAAKPPATPEELAERVVAALKANDFAAFRAVCVVKEDMETYIKAAKDEEARASLKKYADERFTPALEEKLKAHFDLAATTIDWKTVEVTNTEIGKPQAREDGDPPMIHRIKIQLNNKWSLAIPDSVKLDRGWLIGDDNPIRVYDPKNKLVSPKLPEPPRPRPPLAPPDSKPPPSLDGKSAPRTDGKPVPKTDAKPAPSPDGKPAPRPAKDAPVKDAPAKDAVK